MRELAKRRQCGSDRPGQETAPFVQHVCERGIGSEKELQHSAHVLDKPREFVKIFRYREVEFRHALDVLL